MLSLELGTSGTWIAGRLAPATRRASQLTFPRRLRRFGVGAQEDVAGLVMLTHSEAKRPAWDVADEEIVAAVRAHAGDRWVEDLGPIR